MKENLLLDLKLVPYTSVSRQIIEPTGRILITVVIGSEV